MCKRPYKDNPAESRTSAADFLEAAEENAAAAAKTQEAAHACLLGINGPAGIHAYNAFMEASDSHRSAADIFYQLAGQQGACPTI